jgi:hypothetical protein
MPDVPARETVFREYGSHESVRGSSGSDTGTVYRERRAGILMPDVPVREKLFREYGSHEAARGPSCFGTRV